ncbi:Nramp family divalent metal transporter, partial [Streptomyces phaeochromogenes]
MTHGIPAARRAAPVEGRPGPGGASRRAAAFYGPAFVAAVAYVDPGNFATNFQAGAQYGYLLVWVLVSACLIAMFIQLEFYPVRRGLVPTLWWV